MPTSRNRIKICFNPLFNRLAPIASSHLLFIHKHIFLNLNVQQNIPSDSTWIYIGLLNKRVKLSLNSSWWMVMQLIGTKSQSQIVKDRRHSYFTHQSASRHLVNIQLSAAAAAIKILTITWRRDTQYWCSCWCCTTILNYHSFLSLFCFKWRNLTPTSSV